MKKKKRRIKKGVKIVFLILCVIVFSLDIYFIFNKKDKDKYNNNVNNEVKEEVKETMVEDNKEEVVKEPKKEETKEEEKKEETPKKEVTSTDDTSFTTSKGFKGYVKNGITYIDGILIANKTYSLPSTYAPGMNQKVVEAAEKMFAAAKLDGYSIKLQSGFRSYESQKSIYNNYVNTRGKQAADTFSARPGYSEHQSGLAFDVCENSGKYKDACINSNFNDTVEAKWLAKNAHKFGFILRYPNGKSDITGYKYESWHFRYVGDLAEKLYNDGDWITLEEYFGIDSKYKN